MLRRCIVASRPCANEKEHHDLVRCRVAVVIAKGLPPGVKPNGLECRDPLMATDQLAARQVIEADGISSFTAAAREPGRRLARGKHIPVLAILMTPNEWADFAVKSPVSLDRMRPTGTVHLGMPCFGGYLRPALPC
jgi:hypothetical protein